MASILRKWLGTDPIVALKDQTILARRGAGFDMAATTDAGAKVFLNNRERIRFQGRFTCETDTRWVGWSANFGSQGSSTWNQSLGTGADPTVNWPAFGPLVDHEDHISRLLILANCNNAEANGFSLKLFHQTGDLAGTWNSVGETVRTELVSATGVNAGAGNQWKRHQFILDHTVTGEGFMYLTIKPPAGITATRYVRMSGFIENTQRAYDHDYPIV